MGFCLGSLSNKEEYGEWVLGVLKIKSSRLYSLDK
jgi:hypothetical protein